MSTATQQGSVALVDGQQSYAIVFPVQFASNPRVFPTVAMPNDSGEVFSATVDESSVTTLGCTVWLSGVPSAASVGGLLNWMALGTTAAVSAQGSTGIRVVDLFNRVGRRARGGDFTKLSMNGQTDIQEAVNNALQRLYNALPVYYKEMTQGFVLPAPATVTGMGVTQYGKTVTGATFSAAQFGQSIVIDGDPAWNQIIGTDELLNPYMGSTGSVGATIYGNALYSETYPFDRIIGNPMFANQNNNPISPYTMSQGGYGGFWLWQQTLGLPQMWWPQVFGNSQGKSPIMVLRFSPAPQQAYSINVRMSFWPKRVTLADYNANTMLPVPDQFIENCLIPMAIQAFMSSPDFVSRGGRDDDRTEQRGIDGENFAKAQPGQIVAPNNRVGTPIGF